MRIVELLNNITLPITNEEAELLDQFKGREFIHKSVLDEREQRIAHNLTVKEVLLRIQEDGKVAYRRKIK